MKWLIISDTDTTSLRDFITKKNKNASFKLCKEDDIGELLQVSKTIDEISFIIIYSSNQSTDFLPFYTNLTGYAAARELPVWTNISELGTSNIFPSEHLYCLKDMNAIEKDISKNFTKLQKSFIQTSARRTLFIKGIPFTPDCFGQYIDKGKTEICQLFLDGGMDTNVRDYDGTPMLNIAVRSDNYELTEWLIENGADINTESEDRGYTPVMDAVWRGNEKITRFMISKGADLNTICKEGQSNLVLAVGANRPGIVKLLVENGADPDIKDMMGMSAYQYAKLFRKEELVKLLEPFHKE